MKTIASYAAAGLLIGLLLFVGIVFLGMSIGSLAIGALIVGALTFFLYAALGIGRGGTRYWIAPAFSAAVIFAVAISAAGAATETWYVFTATVLLAGVAGAFVRARLRSNSRWSGP